MRVGPQYQATVPEFDPGKNAGKSAFFSAKARGSLEQEGYCAEALLEQLSEQPESFQESFQ